MDLNELISKAKLNEKDLVAVYQYGSRVYGTVTKSSDYDFIVITTRKNNVQFSDNLVNINFYTPEEHQTRLDEHEISALECFFVGKEYVWMEKQKFTFKLDKGKLRQALSAKSSNSWVKAKKKLTVEKDYDLNLGRKSLFHSMRIIYYGIQIAEKGKIFDYTACNNLYHEIMAHYVWNTLFEVFKIRYNNLLTEFRIVAPKDT